MEKNINKVLIFLIVIVLVFIIGITYIYVNKIGVKENTNTENNEKIETNQENKDNIQNTVNNEPIKENTTTNSSDKVTENLEINSYTNFNGKATYGSFIEENGNYETLEINAAKYKLPNNLTKYVDSIMFRITYSKKKYTVYDVKVIDKLTGQIVKDLSANNLKKLYDISYGKKIVNKSWVDTVNLSTLKETEIYKYTATENVTSPPKIVNDIKTNCVVYIKDKDDDKYERKINMYNKVPGVTTGFVYNEFEKGDTYNIIYKKVTDAELVKMIDKDDVIYLSKFVNSTELSYRFEDYIYNDTKNDIVLQLKDNEGSNEKNSIVTIKAGQLYEFNWMVDSVTIKK